MSVTVSIVIPVFNKLAFTRQCLDRIARHASDKVSHEIIVVDNGSTDGTEYFFHELSSRDPRVVYIRHAKNEGFARGNNAGARASTSKYLLFLNNDTLVQQGWLEAMVAVAEADERVGIVGIKQLFPYTHKIHHTGIIFSADRRPQHIYPHADASLSYVSKQREYQAVMGACLLIPRTLFVACGMFDEGYLNGYEDVDLCLTVRERGQSVICCTSSFIYHYGQITETRTADDDNNAARFLAKWKNRIASDELEYFRQDQAEIEAARKHPGSGLAPPPRSADLVYFADDLSSASALTWVTSELVLALHRRGVPVAIRQCTLPAGTEPTQRRELERLMLPQQPVGGVQIRWSHYWPQHLGLELNGTLNLELFVINYLFERPGSQPWDYWLQCLAQNRYGKLPLSGFCRDVLLQTGVKADDCHILNPGYSPEILDVAPTARQSSRTRLLTVTNSHDLGRYGTTLLLEAYWRAFSAQDDVVLVVKDYGASSGDTTLRTLFRDNAGRARIEYVDKFTSKQKLIELYKSCDAFVSAHRGEGYGMKLLDALACGLPAITPLFGGPTDFCTPDNSFPVEFTLSPVGDCLDTRSLHITNMPVWAEPNTESLIEQMRKVVGDPATARRVGEQASRDVLTRFTWANTAEQLVTFLASVEQKKTTADPPTIRVQAPPAEHSPYWMGLRISVVIPTYNRKESLLRTLRALEHQSILPQEFEVLVVDDGSSDGTREMLESKQFVFDLKYYHQANQGPGTARNRGIRHAEGELVLFIGDDIIADECLLEEHLRAHATRHEAGAAVLGHIDWLKGLPRSRVMDFVCGESSLQFAYVHIPKLSALDYRFFYTSNVSVRRQFLVDAADAGITFDSDFRYAAFEDSEYAYRLEKRGLELRYCEAAVAYHDHPMDLESFARREYGAGQMAVVFYRKHPQIDEQLQVRWIGDWADTVDRLAGKPDVDERIRALDADTEAFVRSLAKSLQELTSLQGEGISGFPAPKFTGDSLDSLLSSVLRVVFDVDRTRGKVEEWYRGVEDRDKVEAAKRLIGLMRKLEFFSVQPAEVEKLRGTLNWLNNDVVGGLRTRVRDLERQLGLGGRRSRYFGLDRAVWRVARKTDLYIQQQLSGHEGWLGHYQSVRIRLKQLVRPSSGPQPG